MKKKIVAAFLAGTSTWLIAMPAAAQSTPASNQSIQPTNGLPEGPAPTSPTAPQHEQASGSVADAAPSERVVTQAAAGPGAAADQGAADIVVTGVRASLQRAADIKRRADVVVDSIASEDIGKFPDANVAESLQRITGVAINRNTSGEGQFVTVRGFGPSFNTVLLNGRTVPTQTAGRAFSFDLLPAELIAGADVYKTGQASMQEGGIGATINVRTPRPLDYSGFKAVLSGKVGYEQVSKKAAPQLFGLISDRLLDDKVGVLLAVSYQQRRSQTDSVTTGGYLPNVALPAAGLTGVNIPQQHDVNLQRDNRKRIGVNGVLQYKATDTLLFTLDGLWNRYDVDSHITSLGHFFSPTAIASATLDQNRTATRLTTTGDGHTDFIDAVNTGPTTVKTAGFNAKWTPNDQLSVTADTSWAKTTSTAGGTGQFASKFTVLGFPNVATYDFTKGDVPSLTTAINNYLNPALARTHFAIQQYQDVSDRVFENHLDAKWHLGDSGLTELRGGAFYTDRRKTNVNMQTDPTVLCSYCGYNVSAPSSLLTPFNIGSSFLDGYAGTFPRSFLTTNSSAVFSFLESKAAADAQDRATGKPVGTTYANLQALGGYAPRAQPDSFQVGERTFGAYAEAAFGGSVFDRNWSANIGLRYIHTRSTVNGSQLVLTDLRSIQGDPTMYLGQFAGAAVPVSVKNSYNNFLPSLNAKLELRQNMILRIGASQSVARPNLTDLAPRISFTQFRPGNLQASAGNPGLQPYKSTNFDASYEWYYQPSGFFTVGVFHKHIQDFIVSTVGPETFPVANADNLFPGGTATFGVRRPRNSRSADVKGLEVAFQHTFDWLPAPFDGLGFLVNATFVDSNAKIDPNAISESFALEGLGNSQNATVFYEKGRFSTRFSYNHRNGFLQTLSNPVGGDPVFVTAQGQLDFQASYRMFDAVSLFLEGTNLTNTPVETYGRYRNQFNGLVETGARYAIGVRATF